MFIKALKQKHSMSPADAGRLFDEELRGGSGLGSIARHAMLGVEKKSTWNV
jgi:hypothetical protein